MKLSFVELGERTLPFSFGLNAMRRFEKQTGTSITAMNFDNISIHVALELVYCGFEDGHRKALKSKEIAAGTSFGFSLEDLADAIDENGGLEKLMTLITDSFGTPEQPTTVGKPKATRKRSPKR